MSVVFTKRLGKLAQKPNMWALGISILSGCVSVAAFAIGLGAAMRGSDVTLFPVDAVTFYRMPGNGRLAISMRTEFANTAGSDYPDAITDQWVTIAVNNAPFACFGQRGDAILLSEPIGVVARQSEQARIEQSCAQGSCRAISPQMTLLIRDTPIRRALPAGQVTSAEQFFDESVITPTHACASAAGRLGRPTVAQFIAAAPRDVRVEYHINTLDDGGSLAQCAIRLDENFWSKLGREGYATFACVSASARHL